MGKHLDIRWSTTRRRKFGNAASHTEKGRFRVDAAGFCQNIRGYREGGPTGFSKKPKTPFFRDIEKPFQEVTPIGLEPHPFFSF